MDLENARMNGKTFMVIRSILGLTQGDVANLTGVARSTITKLELGDTKAFGVKTTQKVIEALNMSTRELAAVQTAIRMVEAKFNRGERNE